MIQSETTPVVIVGAGLGGLAAAIQLAARGQAVTVVEKNERVGGKLNLVAGDGYTFDIGPSLLTMPWIIRDLFAVAGRNVDDYLDLMAIEPTCRYKWADGTQFDAWQSLPQLIAEVARLSPDDVGGLFRFLSHTAQIYDIVADRFLLHPFDGLRDLLTPALIGQGPRIDALRSIDTAVRSFFRNRYLRQVFNRYATYNGSSPYLSPATFNVIAYIELTAGGWYPRGGMYELGRALLRLAHETGVEVRTGVAVDEVLVERQQAVGVRLVNGEVLPASRVVVNADPYYAYAGLMSADGTKIPPLIREQSAMAKRLSRLEPSCSGFILLLGVDRVYPQLAHHNIFFSSDYQREFAAIFDKQIPPADPTVYVCASCVTDPQHAPPGHMNLFVLINAPVVNQRVNWQREAGGYRDLVVRKLERMGLSELSRHICWEQIITPADLQTRYNAAGGSIYGWASNTQFAAFLRPPLRSRTLRDLYFVGGGTHPGGGIPLVLLSGRAVAERILADQEKAIRSGGQAARTNSKK